MFKQQNHEKTVGTVNASQLLYGPGGLFGASGLSNEVISTQVPIRGLGPALPAYPNFDEMPLYTFLTGVSDEQGTDPDEVCGDAPHGYMVGGTLSGRFGDVFTETDTIEQQKIMAKINRGVFDDLRLINNSWLAPENSGVYRPGSIDPQAALDNVVNSQMIIAGTLMERKLSRMLWQGDPANNAAGDAGYKEFYGLASLVNNNQIDALDSTPLPGAYSTLVDANFGIIGEGLEIVPMMQYGMEQIESRAEDTFGDAQFVIVMRRDAWAELTEFWPLEYGTNRGASSTFLPDNVTVYVDGRTGVTERDRMRSTRTLEINGKSYPVILDDGIYEANSTNSGDVAAGVFASDIYVLPLRAGSFSTLYWEYFDYSSFAAPGMLGQKFDFWSDGGRFSWAYEGVKWCFKLGLRTTPRLILRTPHLAFRLSNVAYRRSIHFAEPYPDSPYDISGGVSLRTAPTINFP